MPDYTSIIVAVISLCSSGTVAVMTYIFNKKQSKELARQNRELANWKNSLAIQKDAAAALRDYEYDSRKRMYAE